jgi:hypothetical protein
MNLRDNIQKEIENGRLPDIFTTQQVIDLRNDGDSYYVNNEEYRLVTIRTMLPNYSVGPGDRKGKAVKDGKEILFIKHPGRATYSVIDDGDRDEEDQQEDRGLEHADLSPPSEPPMAGASGKGPTDKDKIAGAFVDYLRNKPFRIKKSRNGAWYPMVGSVMGWQERLDAYEWNSAGWEETSGAIDEFIEQLRLFKSSRDQQELQDLERKVENLYLEIRKWGNPKGTLRSGSFIMERLNELWNGGPTIVDSTLTKLYAFAKPKDYIIYDSRVAAAILTIAEDIFRYKTIENRRIETVNIEFHSAYPHLGTYPGSGGTRPRACRWSKWPNAYGVVNAQKDANDLCKRIVRVLNKQEEGERTDWTMREVEAVLFMEGY